MIPKIKAYHKHSLSDKFFFIYLDATYLPLRRQIFEREAVYIASGIQPNGPKEVIDYCIAPNKSMDRNASKHEKPGLKAEFPTEQSLPHL